MTERDTKRTSPMQIVLWVMLAVLAAYIALFALLCVDAFLMGNRLVALPLHVYAPWLEGPFENFVEVIYYPEIQLMRAMRLIPP